MSDLTTTRDHARAMANFRPGRQSESCAGNHNPWTVTTWREPDHQSCRGGDCRCECHKPTRAEKALWRRLADEIDDYLGLPTASVDLFGDLATEPAAEPTHESEPADA